jgi:hypothetical protein
MSCFKKCLKVKEGSAAAKNIDEGVEWIFDSAAKFIRAEAEAHGIVIPDTLEDKLYRYGVKQGALALRDKDVQYYEDKAVGKLTP